MSDAAQIEWLKSRLADLQLPAGKRDHDTREKWLLECGMPSAALREMVFKPLEDAVRIYLEALDGEPEKDAMDEDNVSFASDWSHRKHDAEIVMALDAVRSALAQEPVAGVPMTFSSDDDALEFLKLYGHEESRNGVIRGDWRSFDADCRAAVQYLCDEWDFVFENALSPSPSIPEEKGGTAESVVGWQPIETAPKDGSRFIAWHPDGYPDFFHWQNFGVDSTAPVGWRDSFIQVFREGDGPTHWMPLPASPAEGQP